MKKLLKHTRFWTVVSLFAIDGVVCSLTDPHRIPSFLIIAVFLMLVVSIYQLFRGIIHMIGWYGVSVGHPRRLATILTVMSGGLLALQSIGELTSRDIAVLLPFVLLAYVYFSYGQKAASK